MTSYSRASYVGEATRANTSFVNNASFVTGEMGSKGSLSGLSEKQLLRIAEKKLNKKKATSNLFSGELESSIPSFHLAELEIGRVLGRGGFCVVQDVCSINLVGEDKSENEDVDPDKSEITDELEQERRNMAHNCVREGKGFRYAVKMVQVNTKKPKVFVRGLVDLVAEARLLEHIQGPNIIRIRGVASTSPFRPGYPYFVVVDKLHETLSTRLATSWKKRKPARFALMKRNDKNKDFLVERLSVAYDIANAINHIHQKNIVYRDVTPNNIGFDVRDDVKIFDFGLSKELHPSLLAKDGTYKLTGDCGSLRYMAPEVANCLPYNQSADTYSFSLLLWQILKVEKPFEIYDTRASFQIKVVQKGARPKIDPAWHAKLGPLLKKGWHANLHERSSMATILSALDQIITDESGEGRPEVANHSKHSRSNVETLSSNRTATDLTD